MAEIHQHPGIFCKIRSTSWLIPSWSNKGPFLLVYKLNKLTRLPPPSFSQITYWMTFSIVSNYLLEFHSLLADCGLVAWVSIIFCINFEVFRWYMHVVLGYKSCFSYWQSFSEPYIILNVPCCRIFSFCTLSQWILFVNCGKTQSQLVTLQIGRPPFFLPREKVFGSSSSRPAICFSYFEHYHNTAIFSFQVFDKLFTHFKLCFLSSHVAP